MTQHNLITAQGYENKVGYSWTEGLSLFKPIWYHNLNEEIVLSYQHSWGRSRKGYPNLEGHLNSVELSLRLHFCKPNREYVVGGGTLFSKKENVFKPLFVTCFDSEDKFVLLINPKVNEITQLRRLFERISKKNLGNDIIWTSDIESYCFVDFPTVRFKSFKDQKGYYQSIADNWVVSQTKAIPKLVEEEQLELAL